MQEIIKDNQNKREILECQFAARKYYNKAEGCLVAMLFCSVISTLFVVFPDPTNNVAKVVIVAIPLFLDLVSAIFLICTNQLVKNAALLRNYFDQTVLYFQGKEYSDEDLRQIRELRSRMVSKYTEECKVQITHTSRSNPPGVKDWYEFSREYTDSDVVFECQRQNQWWNKNLLAKRMVCYAIVCGVVIVVSVSLISLSCISVWRIIVSFLGIAISLIDRIFENFLYISLSKKIDNYIELISISKNDDQIKELQRKLEERRAMPVVEMNIIHKKSSKSLSERYEKITSDE